MADELDLSFLLKERFTDAIFFAPQNFAQYSIRKAISISGPRSGAKNIASRRLHKTGILLEGAKNI